MSIQVDVAADGVRVPVALARIDALARAVLRKERVHDATLSFTFVGRRAMAALNRRHLGHRGATDIITFELAAAPGVPLGGDVYIAPEIAREHAAAFGRPVREEIARLVVHGTLHAIGYTHPEDAGREASTMWERQERYVARLFPRLAPSRA
ncbi:MAG TPA: rRNA maturation RNase YbeY [Gemmatirosa sp.]